MALFYVWFLRNQGKSNFELPNFILQCNLSQKVCRHSMNVLLGSIELMSFLDFLYTFLFGAQKTYKKRDDRSLKNKQNG